MCSRRVCTQASLFFLREAASSFEWTDLSRSCFSLGGRSLWEVRVGCPGRWVGGRGGGGGSVGEGGRGGRAQVKRTSQNQEQRAKIKSNGSLTAPPGHRADDKRAWAFAAEWSRLLNSLLLSTHRHSFGQCHHHHRSPLPYRFLSTRGLLSCVPPQGMLLTCRP